MNTQQFSAAAIEGAKNYFDFLDAKGKGREEIRVEHIAMEDAVYLLHLSKNPFSTDAVLIAIGEREYNQKELEIIEQDRDRRILYVRVSKEIADPFMERRAQDVRVVSDLKFLVQRVHDWYVENAEHLKFQCKAPLLHPGHMIQQDMSDGQESAVRDVFSHAQSYVWGAPGTGKTRYVLAECLLQYIQAGGKVAVLAPTNNSIEQVLYGVLDKLQEYDIPLDKVIRLGTPTSKFAEQYGAICEVQGIDKRLGELQGQISFLQSILKHRDFLLRLKHMEDVILPAFDQVVEMLFIMQEQSRDYKDASTHYKAAERNMQVARAEQLQAEQTLNAQQRHMQSLGYRIGSNLSSAMAREGEERLRTLNIKVERSKSNYDAAVIGCEQARCAVKEKQNLADGTDRHIDQRMKELKAYLDQIERFKAIGKQLNRTTMQACKLQILKFGEAGKKVQMEGLEKYSAYSSQTDADIRARISEIENEKIILEDQSTRNRLENAQVVAATVDTFLFRIQPRDAETYIQFDHIFLDEAGYCSLIKGMILFGYQCPVTMLGDHMQLPPVCEINDQQLTKPQYRGAFLFAQSALYVEEAMIYENMTQLLHQYLKHGEPVFSRLHRSNLCETYRFGNGLANTLERHVYKNGFKSADTTREFVIEVLDAKRIPGQGKRQNPAEVEAIKERIAFLATEDFAILTPYRNQVELIGRMLPEERHAQRVMTVHASQGREWDTVFLSVVDTTDMYFTNSKRPELGGLQIINTAVSRAKHRLIIVCDVRFWMRQEGQLIRELALTAG